MRHNIFDSERKIFCNRRYFVPSLLHDHYRIHYCSFWNIISYESFIPAVRFLILYFRLWFQLINAVVEMKQKNPELKLLLSVVSVSSSEDTFAAMVSSANSRQKLVFTHIFSPNIEGFIIYLH